MLKNLLKISFFLFCSFPVVLWAQLDNRFLEEKLSIPATRVQEVHLQIRNLNFFRNNEYFNPIVSGESIFGYQLGSSLVYYPSPRLRLEAGAFLWKNFGESGFRSIQAVFSLKYQKDSTSITFGSLEGNYAHGLIEPLYAFEQGIRRRIENGLQIKHQGRIWRGEVWVDWLKAIPLSADAPEEIFGGLISEWDWVHKEKFIFSWPLQFTIRHIGGQDLQNPVSVVNSINLATGLKAQFLFPRSSFSKRVYTEHYALRSSASSSDQIGGENGLAYYGNLGWQNKYLDILASLWLGKEFDSVIGGEVYRSFSVNQPGRILVHRDLLFIRLMKSVRFQEGLDLGIRFEPYYDFNLQKLESSYGLYLHYQPSFKLFKVKARSKR